MIIFKPLNKIKWNQFKEEILLNENEFPNNLAFSEEDYLKIINYPKNISLIALEGSLFAGLIMGAKLSDEEIEECMVTPGEKEKTIYLYNFLTAKEYRGKGVGKAILKEWINIAKKKGFTECLGHYRKNNSESLIKRFGAVEKKVCPQWEGTNEEFVMCSLAL